MVLHRAHTMKPTWNNFTCRTYKKEGAEVCTAHYIRECVLDEAILEDLRRVTAMAREHTREFAEYIGSRQSAEIQREIRRLERELTPELLRLFIQKIVVHEKSTKWSKKATQTIEIHYNDIGYVGRDIPQDKESPRQEISA